MEEFHDPILKEIMSRYDSKLVKFILSHEEQIITQLHADQEYQNGDKEVPAIPLFDSYLISLKPEVEDEIREAGYFNGSAARLIEYFSDVFYHTTLPDLAHYKVRTTPTIKH